MQRLSRGHVVLGLGCLVAAAMSSCGTTRNFSLGAAGRVGSSGSAGESGEAGQGSIAGEGGSAGVHASDAGQGSIAGEGGSAGVHASDAGASGAYPGGAGAESGAAGACDGATNEGCLCIEGVTTRPCGVCQDGTQTCSNGKTGQYGACSGGTMKTYYLDDDSDGHAVNVSTTGCGPAPAKYITGPVDDCDDQSGDVFPGQTRFFALHRGDGSFDYDCNGFEEPEYKTGHNLLCASCTTGQVCICATFRSAPACGEPLDLSICTNCSLTPAVAGNPLQPCR